MMDQKRAAGLVRCLVFSCLSLNLAWAQENRGMAPLPITLPLPSFTGTPLNYQSPHLERRRTPFLAPVGTTNVARGKAVTTSADGPLSDDELKAIRVTLYRKRQGIPKGDNRNLLRKRVARRKEVNATFSENEMPEPAPGSP